MIYIIGTARGSSVKIGYTSGDPARRLAELQTGNDKELKLLATLPGSRREETAMHQAMSNQRVRGEWFHASVAECVAAWQKAQKPVGAFDVTPARVARAVALLNSMLDETGSVRKIDARERGRTEGIHLMWIYAAVEEMNLRVYHVDGAATYSRQDGAA